jgi:hypothetical protein
MEGLVIVLQLEGDYISKLYTWTYIKIYAVRFRGSNMTVEAFEKRI